MSEIQNIAGIGKSFIQLLNSVGIDSIESLAGTDAESLRQELSHANLTFQFVKRAPSITQVQKWINDARSISNITKPVASIPSVSSCSTIELASPRLQPEEIDIHSLPVAIPLPVQRLIDRRILVADIPPAILLEDEAVGQPEEEIQDAIPVIQPLSESATQELDSASDYEVSTQAQHRVLPDHPSAGSRLKIDTSKVRTTDEAPRGPVRKAVMKTAQEDERIALIRGPKEKTNSGRDPNSRFYIRGVLHSHPWSMALGALSTLILISMVPIAVCSGMLLLLSDLMPQVFSWVPKWFLIPPFALPLFAIFYLIFGIRASCRICGQKQFWPKACLKNKKAHHVKGIGYIVPVAIHMLIFKWFRCTYCGTPVRLVK
ncbi:MAG: DUF4332 domain-containing protein [Verrucomicrobia bacterium]|nr:MAG: DUF4332 domain-containing protein [Verrucomicrobiota bacterium]